MIKQRKRITPQRDSLPEFGALLIPYVSTESQALQSNFRQSIALFEPVASVFEDVYY